MGNSSSREGSFLISPDSVSKRPGQREMWEPTNGISMHNQIMKRHPYFDFESKAVSFRSDKKNFQGKELLFYLVTTLVLIFALLKLVFAKYFNDLIRVFFRTTLKQRQIKEQLIQTPFPSLLFNGFFVASTGLYINLFLHYIKFTPEENFLLLFLYCCSVLYNYLSGQIYRFKSIRMAF